MAFLFLRKIKIKQNLAKIQAILILQKFVQNMIIENFCFNPFLGRMNPIRERGGCVGLGFLIVFLLFDAEYINGSGEDGLAVNCGTRYGCKLRHKVIKNKTEISTKLNSVKKLWKN
jgi:hypothetical protein